MSDKKDPKKSAAAKGRSEKKAAVTGRFVTKGEAQGSVTNSHTTIGRFVSKHDGVFGGHQIVNGAIEPKISKNVPEPPPKPAKTSDKDDK